MNIEINNKRLMTFDEYMASKESEVMPDAPVSQDQPAEEPTTEPMMPAQEPVMEPAQPHMVQPAAEPGEGEGLEMLEEPNA